MDFRKIKWQFNIIQNIQQNLTRNSLRHVILFVGDTETALQLAHATAGAVLCDTHADNMCGVCPSCLKLLAGSHPDKITVKKLTNKVGFGVEEVRDMIEKMYIKPFSGSKKVFIFEKASALTPAAQNALLKVIEEPPAYGMVILCAEKEEDLLPTVLSRIPHKYKLTSPKAEEIEAYLSAKYPEKRKLATFCAAFCQGNPILAEELIKQDGATDVRKRLCIFLDKLCGTEKSCIFNFCGYLKDNKDDFPQISAYLVAIWRDILFIKQNLSSIVNQDLRTELCALSEKWSTKALLEAVNGFTALHTALQNSANFEGAILNFLLETQEALHDRNCWS